MERDQQQIFEPFLGKHTQSIYFKQFIDYLGSYEKFNATYEQIQLYYSYYMSRKVEDIVNNHTIIAGKDYTQHFKQIGNQISRNEQICDIVNFFKRFKKNKKKSKKRSSTDRKNSLFRTITKHLKLKLTKKMTKSQKLNQQTTPKLGYRLNKNTISQVQIKQMMDKYGDLIQKYLGSSQVYEDILLKNKSKISKCFYLMHLKSILIQTKKRRLHKYSFFSRKTLIEEIQCIADIYFKDRYQRYVLEQNKEMQKVMLQTQEEILIEDGNLDKQLFSLEHNYKIMPTMQSIKLLDQDNSQDFNTQGLFDIIQLSQEQFFKHQDQKIIFITLDNYEQS